MTGLCSFVAALAATTGTALVLVIIIDAMGPPR